MCLSLNLCMCVQVKKKQTNWIYELWLLSIGSKGGMIMSLSFITLPLHKPHILAQEKKQGQELSELSLALLMSAHNAAGPLILNLNHVSKLCHYVLIKSGLHIVSVCVCLHACNWGDTMKDVCKADSCYQVLALMRFRPSKTVCDYSHNQEWPFPTSPCPLDYNTVTDSHIHTKPLSSGLCELQFAKLWLWG